MSKRKWESYPEIERVLERLEGGAADDLVIIFIPSRTSDEKDIPQSEQQAWADQALNLFGELFEGATGFEHLRGIYQPRGEPPQYDNPIMIQSLVKRADLEAEENLLKLAKFCRNLGEKLKQNAVGLVVNDVFINVMIPRGRGQK